MKRILLVTLDFLPRRGGVARYLGFLATYFQKNITVWATSEGGTDEFDGKAEYKIERKKLINRKIWPKWLGVLEMLLKSRKDFDVLMVSHVLPLGTVAFLAKIWFKKPYIVFVHGLDIALVKKSAWKKWLTTRILRDSKLVVANSNFLAGEIVRDFGVQRIEVCYPPVEKAKTTSKNKTDELRILTVSRLIERKGHLRVLSALSELKKRDELGNIKYQIVGSGPMAEKIIETIETLGLSDVVILNQSVSDEDLVVEYQSADMFVMPIVWDSVDREGFGMVYMEAAAYGIPSIATQMPGVDEAILHKETGILISDGDEEALQQAILSLATDSSLRSKLGKAARNRIAKFSPEASFSKLRKHL